MKEQKTGIDKKLAELEKIVKGMEGTPGFDKSVELFTTGAKLVKELTAEVGTAAGKITEIIKDVDGVIERELKLPAKK